MNLNDLILTQSICAMFYSEAGIGRTDLMGSAGSRNLIFSDRNGLVTLKNPSFQKRHPNVNPHIELVEPDKKVDQPKAFEFIKDRIDWWMAKRSADFDAVSIDDSTFLQGSARNMAITLNGLTGRSKTADKIATAYKGNVIMTESDFGTEMEFVFSFFRDTAALCRQMGKHFIVNAHEMKVWVKKRGEEPTLIQIAPAFTGKKEPTKNNTHFDLVFRLTRQGKGTTQKVVAQCIPDDIVSAKDRYAVFNMYENNLTWPIIAKRVQALEPLPEETIPLEPETKS